MPTLLLHFPGGRYHATPWGYHVNEGLIEWPPSPWRLLRALIACGYATQSWTEIPPVGRRLIETLAKTLPAYNLPPASAAHSRHYMPLGVLDKGREKKTLVFDTWANIGDGELVIRWECKLGDEETALLARLAENLSYLGRSESWTGAKLVSEAVLPPSCNTYPHTDGHNPGPEWEQVALMAAVTPEKYAQWRQQTTDAILADLPLPEGKKKPPKKLLDARVKAVALYPTDLLDCLQKDTAWWQQYHWCQPPGSQRVLYWRRNDALEVGVPQQPRHPIANPVEMMLLSLTTPSGNKSALPPCSRTLPQAELFHRAIIGRVAKGRQVYCPELTGRDDNGKPLRNGHRHAHILPVDLDSDGHIDHIIVYAPMLLSDAAQKAIRGIRRTWAKGGVGDLQLSIAGAGDLAMLRSLPKPLGCGIEKLLGPLSGSRVWVSTTPFIPPRFLKKRGSNTLKGQINAELVSRGLPFAEKVEVLPWTNEDSSWGGGTLKLRHFVTCRKRGSEPPPVDICYVIRLRFAKKIPGPIVIGYGSHFGLGVFGAEEDTV
jgi:CRISPR-associated protein Csb2